MTKYILAGGNDKEASNYPNVLKKELPASLSSCRLLSCFFSSPENAWQERASDTQKWFAEQLGITKHEYATFDRFLEQLENSDIIYFHGGDTPLLLDSLKKYENLKDYFKGKIIIGSSAGANILAKNYWSSTYRKPGKGFGLVDANVMVHYGVNFFAGTERGKEDWQKDEEAFKQFADSQDILHLPEGEIKVFEVEE